MILCDVVEDTMLHKACSLVFGRLTLAFSHMYFVLQMPNLTAARTPCNGIELKILQPFRKNAAKRTTSAEILTAATQPQVRVLHDVLKRGLKEVLEHCTTARRPSYSSRACNRRKTFVFKSTRGCRTALTYVSYANCHRSPNK